MSLSVKVEVNILEIVEGKCKECTNVTIHLFENIYEINHTSINAFILKNVHKDIKHIYYFQLLCKYSNIIFYESRS